MKTVIRANHHYFPTLNNNKGETSQKTITTNIEKNNNKLTTQTRQMQLPKEKKKPCTKHPNPTKLTNRKWFTRNPKNKK
jgi:hypothetical protein